MRKDVIILHVAFSYNARINELIPSEHTWKFYCYFPRNL